mgnify:CR=1 FL=1
MNEQILKLYKQAQEFAYKNISKESWNTDNFHAVVSGKFAELIVRECVTLADKESERYSNLDQEYCSMAMDNYRELVLKHFGVEE